MHGCISEEESHGFTQVLTRYLMEVITSILQGSQVTSVNYIDKLQRMIVAITNYTVCCYAAGCEL